MSSDIIGQSSGYGGGQSPEKAVADKGLRFSIAFARRTGGSGVRRRPDVVHRQQAMVCCSLIGWAQPFFNVKSG
ncbi:MAG: hypothetical protein ACLPX5_06920 [Dissulfurispiraceae bacterium]